MSHAVARQTLTLVEIIILSVKAICSSAVQLILMITSLGLTAHTVLAGVVTVFAYSRAHGCDRIVSCDKAAMMSASTAYTVCVCLLLKS